MLFENTVCGVTGGGGAGGGEGVSVVKKLPRSAPQLILLWVHSDPDSGWLVQ